MSTSKESVREQYCRSKFVAVGAQEFRRSAIRHGFKIEGYNLRPTQVMTFVDKQRNDDVTAITRLGERYFEATNAGDAERCIATMAADVIIMPPDAPSIIGVEQLRRRSQAYHAQYSAKYKLVFDEIEVFGDTAFARTTVSGMRTQRSDGSVEQLLWRNLWIVKRQVDGQWKFWRIIFNAALFPEAH
jgi:uncharacterized protein (TIGR02246 family)